MNDGTDTIFRGVGLTVSAINITAVAGLAPGVLPNATQTVPYNASVSASGGAGGYTYTASGLPSGLSINSSTGAITGTISLSTFGIGRSSVSVTAKDSNLVSYTKTMSIDVMGLVAALPTVAPSGLGFDGCSIGVPCSRNVNVLNGGVAPFTWSASGLPAGMTIRTGSGVTGNGTIPGDAEIWGAPTAAGLFNVEVVVTDAIGATATNTFPLRVATIMQVGNAAVFLKQRAPGRLGGMGGHHRDNIQPINDRLQVALNRPDWLPPVADFQLLQGVGKRAPLRAVRCVQFVITLAPYPVVLFGNIDQLEVHGKSANHADGIVGRQAVQ
jgi:hypothetical protein